MHTSAGTWFLKWNQRDALPQFSAEQAGLTLLADGAPTGLHIPRPTTTGHSSSNAWLLIPWMELQAAGDPLRLAECLVVMHRVRKSAYGWQIDNYLGRSVQRNGRLSEWADFWWQRRLLPHLEAACGNGYASALKPVMDDLHSCTQQLLVHQPEPALLHGDLWSGNQAWLADGRPTVFDPAPYFGDRETDLAMMRLFGGFSRAVFDSYEKHWPLPPGAAQREPLYQLYHLLNHLNLFGDSWLPQVLQVADQLVKGTRLNQQSSHATGRFT